MSVRKWIVGPILLSILGYYLTLETETEYAPREVPEGWQEIERNDQTSALISKGFWESTGPVVVLQHGFPDFNYSWKKQIDLIQQGYRILAPRLRGYEVASVSPNPVDYSIPALAEDLLDWLRFINVTEAHIVGHDWGSAIAYMACVQAPQYCKSVVLVAVPPLKHMRRAILSHPMQVVSSSYMLFFQLPFLPEWVIRWRNFAFLDWIWKVWSPSCSEDLSMLKGVFAEPDVLSSALQYYRTNAQAIFFPDAWTGINTTTMLHADIETPLLAISGNEDGCMRTDFFETVCEMTKTKSSLAFHRIQDAGHFVHLEAPQDFNTKLVEFYSAI